MGLILLGGFFLQSTNPTAFRGMTKGPSPGSVEQWNRQIRFSPGKLHMRSITLSVESSLLGTVASRMPSNSLCIRLSSAVPSSKFLTPACWKSPVKAMPGFPSMVIICSLSRTIRNVSSCRPSTMRHHPTLQLWWSREAPLSQQNNVIFTTAVKYPYRRRISYSFRST